MEGPAELELGAVLRFLAARGGRSRLAELAGRFGAALGGEPAPRARLEELLAAVAAVRTDPADGAEYVHLRGQLCEGAPPRVAGAPPPEAPGASGRGPGEPPGRGGGEADGARSRRPAARGEARGGPGEAAAPKAARPNARDPAPGGSPQPERRAGPGGGDSDDASAASSSAEEEGGGGAPVALDPLEHAWMLSAADGQWDGLEGLLGSDPGLLAKRDFITGFTCLHWAAKHGRQEVLALLVNFARKHRLPVNINARTSGGYTALHLAAMHGHAEVVKLLVGAYDADVDARDYSGRKAAQYLSRGTAEEIRGLVGGLDLEPREGAAGGGGGRWRLSKVLPSHLVAYRLAHVPEDGGDPLHPAAEAPAGGKAKEPGRKAAGSSGGRSKPRLSKMRFRTQIVHTTPPFRGPDQPLEEGEEEDDDDDDDHHSLRGHSSACKLRPKSNVFG